ncbi:MAG TPA: tetratricopeptide repeat protein [Prolixibacteraceae bacterium]|nr:tetratricopeptide repeat protein [Prolixibacteraceae bacterium]
MKIKSQIIKAFVIFFFYSFPLFSQPIATQENCKETFRTAIELFNAEKYGSAIHEFQKLREIAVPGSVFEDEADYHIPVCYLEMGNQNGRSMLEAFIQDTPESPRINNAYFRLGNADFNKKRYKQALVSFKKIERNSLTGKELEEYSFKSGFCNLEEGNNSIAKVFFAGLKDKPGTFSDASKYYWAHINYLEGKYDLALQEFVKIEKTPQYAAIIPFYKAQIYFAQEKYEQVIEIAPPLMDRATAERKVELSKIIGVSYYQLKQYKEAIPYIENYLKSKDVTPQQYYVAGFCFGKEGQNDKAIQNMEKAAKGKDAFAQNAYYELAGLYIKKGDKQRAMMAFQNASNLNFDPKIREDALFQYAKITYELDYSPFNEAIKAFDRYISEYPNSEKNDVAYDYLVKVFMTTRNYKDALVSLEKIKVKSPAIKKAYQRVALNRGIEFFRDLKFAEAIQLFDKSLEYGDQSNELRALAYYWRGDANFRLGKSDLAVADYKKFQSVPGASKLKEYPVSNYNIGYNYFNKEQYELAIPWFQKYFEGRTDKSSPLYTDAYNRLGDCYFADTRYDDAIANYQKAYEAGSLDSDYSLFQKAFCHGLLNENNLKINELDNLQTQFPQSNYIDDALYETGKSFERLQEESKAESNYLTLISKFPASPYKPKALVQLGLLAYNKSDYAASVAYYKQVAENYPNSPEAKGAMVGIRNNAVENNKVSEYISYTKKLGHSATPSENEQDSLTYFAAEKLYMAKDTRAKEELGKYLENFPSGSFSLNVHFYKAETEFRDNEPEDAISDYDFILAQPDNIFTENALLRASELTYKAGDFKKALGYYERLETVSNNNSNKLLSLAGRMRCHYELKEFDAVAKIGWKIRSMDKIPPELDREASYKSAKAYVELNDPAKALPLWRKLSADSKSLEGAEAKYRVCEYFYTNNKLKEAENEVMDFIEKNTPHQYWLAKSFILLAHVYENQNDLFQATNTLKSIIENYEIKGDGILDEANQYLQKLESKETTGSGTSDTKIQPSGAGSKKK